MGGGDTPIGRQSFDCSRCGIIRGSNFVAALGGAKIDVLVAHEEVDEDSMRWVPRGGAEMAVLVVVVVVLQILVLEDSSCWGATMLGESILFFITDPVLRGAILLPPRAAALLKVKDFNRRGIVGGRTN